MEKYLICYSTLVGKRMAKGSRSRLYIFQTMHDFNIVFTFLSPRENREQQVSVRAVLGNCRRDKANVFSRRRWQTLGCTGVSPLNKAS